MPSPLLALILSLGLQSWHVVAFCCRTVRLGENSDFTIFYIEVCKGSLYGVMFGFLHLRTASDSPERDPDMSPQLRLWLRSMEAVPVDPNSSAVLRSCAAAPLSHPSYLTHIVAAILPSMDIYIKVVCIYHGNTQDQDIDAYIDLDMHGECMYMTMHTRYMCAFFLTCVHCACLRLCATPTSWKRQWYQQIS